MTSAWTNGSTRQWRRVRLAVLKRDNWVCQLAIPGICTGAAEHVHHTVARHLVGDNPAYLVASCAACNLGLGQPGRPRRGRRAPRPRPRKYNRW